MPIPFVHQALQMAIYDEYRAHATYQRVIETFGQVAPFHQIVQAESRHIQALLPLLQRYHVPIPIDDWYLKITPAHFLKENCELGVAGEIENGQMYDHLLSVIHEPDIRSVFTQLRDASLLHHLPAFRQCVGHYAHPPVDCSLLKGSTDIPVWVWLMGGIAAQFLLL